MESNNETYNRKMRIFAELNERQGRMHRIVSGLDNGAVECKDDLDRLIVAQACLTVATAPRDQISIGQMNRKMRRQRQSNR